MRSKFSYLGLLAIPFLMAACADSNNFSSLQTQESSASALNTDIPVTTLPTQKATVMPNPPEKPADKVTTESDAPSANPSPSVTPAASPQPATGAQPEVTTKKESTFTKLEIAEKGFLTPTVYYFPVYDEDKASCPQNEKVILHGEGGKNLIRVCRKNLKSCGLQGTCSIIQKGKIRLFNILARISGQDRFFEINREECRFGYGVRNICLDPFYTIAADLDYYKAGDVIYVPAVVGTVLPSGTVHDGYFIVRDKGRGIHGRGRFDFYSGLMSWIDPKNPLTKLGLADKKTSVQYYKVIGQKAKDVIARRMYPKIPPPK